MAVFIFTFIAVIAMFMTWLSNCTYSVSNRIESKNNGDKYYYDLKGNRCSTKTGNPVIMVKDERVGCLCTIDVVTQEIIESFPKKDEMDYYRENTDINRTAAINSGWDYYEDEVETKKRGDFITSIYYVRVKDGLLCHQFYTIQFLEFARLLREPKMRLCVGFIMENPNRRDVKLAIECNERILNDDIELARLDMTREEAEEYAKEIGAILSFDGIITQEEIPNYDYHKTKEHLYRVEVEKERNRRKKIKEAMKKEA